LARIQAALVRRAHYYFILLMPVRKFCYDYASGPRCL
jgi:hypothetical protein